MKSFLPCRSGAALARLCVPVLATALASNTRAAIPPETPTPPESQQPPTAADEVSLERVVVIGRATPDLPTPMTVQTAEQIATAPVTDSLDLFRKTPGAITVNFGQGDIGNPIGLRGFVSDHGQDVAIFIDGVPINVSNHAHAHGLADIGWLLPEMVERIEVIKGPFSAQYGNFALGGVINIITKTADDTSLLASGGTYGQGRLLGVYGKPIGTFTPFVLGEVDHSHGYRDNEQYNRYNFFDKTSTSLFGGTASARVQAVARDFGAPGYLPLTGVQSNTFDRTDAVNASDGGNSKLYDAVFNFVPGRRGGPNLTAYAGHDELNRYADFGLPGLPPALRTGQREDHTERNFYGWRGSYSLALGQALGLTLGTDGQYDDGVYQRFPTTNRQRGLASRDRAATQLGTAAWAQATLKAGPYITVLGGLRYDRFDIRVDNRLTPANSGRATPNVVSPKVGVVVTPMKGVEAFANVGRGFRSPAAQELSPDGAGTRFGSLHPATLASGDAGLKLKPVQGLTLTLDYYLTKTHDEIAQQATDFVNVGATRRRGYELSANYDVTADLNLFASFSGVRARLDSGQASGQNYLANVPTDSQTFGLTWTTHPRGDIRVIFDNYIQRLGEQPLNANRSTVAPSVVRYATKASVLTSSPWSGYVQLVYVPDQYASESIFDFGDPGAPDVRYAPNPVLNAQAAVKYTFR